MTMAKTTSIQLGDHFETFIAKKLDEGTYRNASELIREGLRRIETDEQKLESLRAKLARGERDIKEGRFKVYESVEKLREAINRRIQAHV